MIKTIKFLNGPKSAVNDENKQKREELSGPSHSFSSHSHIIFSDRVFLRLMILSTTWL